MLNYGPHLFIFRAVNILYLLILVVHKNVTIKTDDGPRKLRFCNFWHQIY